MVGEIRIYIEGGGDSSETKRTLKRGFSGFFSTLILEIRAKRIKFDLILCGGRQAAYEAFMYAIDDHPDAFNVLLVDAEAAVVGKKWAHLKKRDKWSSRGLSEEHCHLMVQVMEAWFLAGPDGLEAYYSDPGFSRKALPSVKNVETVDKARVYTALKEATLGTRKGEYHKIKHASALLDRLRIEQIRGSSKHLNDFYMTINSKISNV